MASEPRLSTLMRAVLMDAKSRDLHRTAGDWPAHPSTLAALVRHGFLARNDRRNKRGNRVTVWSITTEGRKALLPRERRRNEPIWYPVRFDKATANLTADCDEESYQARGYTTNPKWASERTSTDPDQTQQPASLARHIAARSDEHVRREAKKLGRQVHDAAVYAAKQGLIDELDALRRTVAEIDQLRRRDAA